MTENFTNSTSESITNTSGSGVISAIIVVLSIIIIVGVIGNSMVIAVVGCIPSMKTTTNFLIVNVAVSDIITLLLTALHVGLSRIRGRVGANVFFCKVVDPNTLSNTALIATGLTLTVLSVERYNALVKPMAISRRLTKNNVGYVIVAIWVVSMVMALPMLVYLYIDPSTGMCTPGDEKENLYISLTFIVIFMTIVPFLVIAFSYFQIISGLYFKNTICNATAPGQQSEDLVAKRKLVKLLLTVTVIFFIAFVPYGVALILKFSLNAKHNAQQLKNLRELSKVSAYLMPLHSSINPFLYAFQSQNYRHGFKVVIRKIFYCRNAPENNDIQPSAAV
ncbi:predicted protein [Nematostella vectensis]|uniref:G-protein coupled receptors family 1 profile domain-containing protein n=1 Tax=Nematostella vectensis TaxID=45351 RepID=A7REP5_NEMVE|nr:predicted protein [Nematostella vectensis]|eukprot:XP_001641892.1 predicted protein [Nematostella vectensis]